MTLQELTGTTSEAIFQNPHIILVPRKAERNLRKYVSKNRLRSINPDLNVAVEKCLLVLSYLSPTLYNSTIDQWKALNSVILHKQTKNGSDNTYVYKKVLEALKAGTKQTGPIIEVKTNSIGEEVYKIGTTSKMYRICDTYRKGLTEYVLTTPDLRTKRTKSFWTALSLANNNAIGRNLMTLYPSIELPTQKELLKEGKRLVKAKTITGKGKKLTMRNKHTNDYWSDVSDRSFVEDNIEVFNYLTSRGYMIPVVGDEKSGGRVVDSFTLMPSWIRKMIKIDGKSIVEADYSALHPNLAQNIYGNALNQITHDIVADYLGITRQEAKIEHLSFFNKRIEGMNKSPLYKYYQDNHPAMLNNIIEDKTKWYKHTSLKMFKLEVDLMTEVISRLNEEGVFVMYVYDALYATEKNFELVKTTMNEVAAEMNVKTAVGVLESVSNEVSPVEEVSSPESNETALKDFYYKDELINLREFLPAFGMTQEKTNAVIRYINFAQVTPTTLMSNMLKVFKENRYDHTGIDINKEEIMKLKNLVR